MSIINLRTKAAFGGVMGKDGRKAYVGGSYSGSTSSSGKGSQGSGKGYQGGSAAPGSAEAGKGGGGSQYKDDGGYTSTSNPTGTVTKKIRDIQKFNYDKQFYDIGDIGPSHSRKSYFQKKKIQNVLNYINSQKKQNKAKLDAGVFNVLDDYEGTFNDLSYADRVALARSSALSFQDPNLALAGGKKGYSQKTINDILSGKRSIPNFYSKIDVANAPTFFGKGAAIGANILGKTFSGPVTKERLDELFSKGEALDKLDPTKETTFGLMKQFEPDRYERQFGPKVGGDGEGAKPYIPFDYNPRDEDEDEDVVEPYTNDFVYRFGTGQNVGENVLRGYAADGGIMGTRARRAMGGIMGRLDQRQGYLFGGVTKAIGKAVKGVAKAAGKVLKSDLGKAAMLYAGGVYLGGGNIFSAGAYNPANFLGKKGYLANIAGKALLKDPTKGFGIKDNLSLTKILGLSAALPFIPGINKAPENEDIGMADRGGRLIDPLTGEEGTPASMRANIENAKIEAGGDPVKLAALNQAYNNMLFTNLPYANYGNYAQGGRIRAEEGGLMNLGGMEKDYRAEGGFVPIGKQEKADDVPARLSVNEFVFTADAVRNAGGGDIDKGAEVMENMMKNLENGGTVSEESQGNTGAQQMFSVSERIGEVI